LKVEATIIQQLELGWFPVKTGEGFREELVVASKEKGKAYEGDGQFNGDAAAC
jgi:hypothetical protein